MYRLESEAGLVGVVYSVYRQGSWLSFDAADANGQEHILKYSIQEYCILASVLLLLLQQIPRTRYLVTGRFSQI